jgi:glycine cleavage system regulatory protein
MMTPLVLTLIGQDQPGLVSAIAQKISACGGNWQDSRMASMAGKFAGLLLVSVPDTQADALIAALRTLEQQGLRLVIERGSNEAPAAAGRTLTLTLTGLDRPGIVRDISDALARRKVSIKEMQTVFFNAAFSGENMFEMHATLHAPHGMGDEALRLALDELARHLMVDIGLGQAV